MSSNPTAQDTNTGTGDRGDESASHPANYGLPQPSAMAGQPPAQFPVGQNATNVRHDLDPPLLARPPWQASRFLNPPFTVRSVTASLQRMLNQDRKLYRPKVTVPPQHFGSADKKLLHSGAFWDAKVIANGKTYNVHKSVLCLRNKWFRTIFDSDFREGETSVVEISAPDNIERLLEFLYTGAVDLSNEADILTAANELSVLGDFYLSDELKDYAAKVLGQYLGEHLTATSDLERHLELPGQYRSVGSRPSAARASGAVNFQVMQEAGFVDRLCVAIRDAYATPSGIHLVYVDFVAAARIRTFRCPMIQALKDELPEFGADLLTAMMTGLRTKAFEGNKAFEKWKDPLVRSDAAGDDRKQGWGARVDPDGSLRRGMDRSLLESRSRDAWTHAVNNAGVDANFAFAQPFRPGFDGGSW